MTPMRVYLSGGPELLFLRLTLIQENEPTERVHRVLHPPLHPPTGQA